MESSLIKRKTEKALWSLKGLYSKDSIKIISSTLAARETLMAYTKESFSMASGKDMEHFSGTMENFLRENGGMVRKMGLESGNLLEEIFMKETGFSIGSTGKVFTSIVSVLIEDNSLNF